MQYRWPIPILNKSKGPYKKADAQAKRTAYKTGIQRQTTWKELRNTAWACRGSVKEATAQLEFGFAEDVTGNKNSFYYF